MAKLFLLRHAKAQWNTENRFTGYVDAPLDRNETQSSVAFANKIFGQKIDKIYCSPLFRNLDTVSRNLEIAGKYPIFIHLDGGKMQKWGNYTDISEYDMPVFVSEKFNERYYGDLQGLNKGEVIKKYGPEQVRLWRRSYNIAPPRGESLKDVFKRAVPFYKKYAEKDLRQGSNVLIVASHNALRAIIKYIEKISDEKIIDFEIPFGGLFEYEFDDFLNIKRKNIL